MWQYGVAGVTPPAVLRRVVMVRMSPLFFVSVYPVLSIALLGGIVLENHRHVTPADAEPYHARAKAAVNSIKYSIGYWTGKDDEVPPAAQQLLRPNAVLSRTYIDNGFGPTRGRHASLLIVQTRDTRDMGGHFPPICYVTHGDTMTGATARTFNVDGISIPGYEYEFQRTTNGVTARNTVFNFFIIPKQGFCPDMTGIRKAAENYQQRVYGAAQFQLVMSSDLSADERDSVFATLVGAQGSVIRTLLDLPEENSAQAGISEVMK
jgi:hypothetical protein